MTRAQWQAVADATHEVLEEAIRYEGSTLSDGTYRNALGGQGGYQNHHRVYAKAGQPCRSCAGGAVIQRIVQACVPVRQHSNQYRDFVVNSLLAFLILHDVLMGSC